jgi:hypothetical protein
MRPSARPLDKGVGPSLLAPWRHGARIEGPTRSGPCDVGCVRVPRCVHYVGRALNRPYTDRRRCGDGS